MKKLVTAIMLVATTSAVALVAAEPAIAAPQRHHQERSFQGSVEGEGYYEGTREMRIDTNDRASSPYAGGGF
jgi:flagellar basal body-associated protein FliL